MRLGDRRHGVDDVVGALLVDRREIEHRAARIVVAALVARVFAGEESAGERAPHHDAEALILDHRHDLALEFAPRDRVIGLHRLEARVAALLSEMPSAFMICQAARFEQPIVLTSPRLTQSSSARSVSSSGVTGSKPWI